MVKKRRDRDQKTWKSQNQRESTIFDWPLLGNQNVSDKILSSKFLKSCQLTFNKISANSEKSTFFIYPPVLDSPVQRLLISQNANSALAWFSIAGSEIVRESFSADTVDGNSVNVVRNRRVTRFNRPNWLTETVWISYWNVEIIPVTGGDLATYRPPWPDPVCS